MRCMRCPHCRATPRYRDRGDGCCPACGRAFALDPRTNAMRLNDLRFRHLAARLGADGLWSEVVERWAQVYDATPERLIGDAGGGGVAGPPAGRANRPLLVLVAVDAGVRSCLVANGVS